MSIYQFEKDTYKNSIEKIFLTEEQKSAISKNAIKSYRKREKSYDNTEKVLEKFYSVWIKAAATVVAVALIVFFTCFSIGIENSRNSFYLVASASENNSEQAKIRISTDISDAGFSMITTDENGVEIYRNKQGKKDYFVRYELSDLKVLGRNIDTISFRTKQKSTYFIVKENNETDFEPLTNSQYTQKEIIEHGDGMYGVFCDGFTYKNIETTNEEQIISLGKLVQIVIESDRRDKEIDSYIQEIDEATNRINEYKIQQYNKTNGVGGGVIPDEINDESEIIQNNTDKFLQKVLKDAFIEVNVKYKDSSKKKYSFAIEYDGTDDGYYWLTINPNK